VRVLQINSVCGIGSTGRIATDLHQVLIEHGHESYIAYGRGKPQNCENAVKIGTKYNTYHDVITTRLFDNHGFGSRKATIELIHKIDEINPDVIHLHNLHGYYINIEILFDYLKKINKRVIWTLHDCWPFTGHCSHFELVGCHKWKTGCYRCPQKSYYPSSYFLDNSQRNYERKKRAFTGLKNLTIVTPSKWLSELAKKSFLSEYDVLVINNGIDLNVFKPTQSDVRKKLGVENKFVILGVASVWGERKGFDCFLRLAEVLNDDQIIVLVGLTEKQISNLPANIIGISRTNNVTELSEIYSMADVFLNPTLEDNFPTVNLEALACGVPVLTFNTGGSAECIDEDVGKITSEHTLLTDILTSRHYDRSKCREKALNYDKRNQYMRYIELYERGN